MFENLLDKGVRAWYKGGMKTIMDITPHNAHNFSNDNKLRMERERDIKFSKTFPKIYAKISAAIKRVTKKGEYKVAISLTKFMQIYSPNDMYYILQTLKNDLSKAGWGVMSCCEKGVNITISW